MKRKLLALLLVGTICLSFTGCSSGVPELEHQRVLDEKAQLESRVAELESRLAEEDSSVASTQSSKPASGLPSSDESSQEDSAAPSDVDTLISKLEVKEYSYSTDYWNYAFLVIKNNSDFNLNISADVKFYNTEGNLIAAKSGSQEAVEKGYSTILYFMPDEKFEKMDYEISANVEERFDCVLSDLSYEDTTAQDKVILSVTNNGDEPAEFVQASVLFFQGDKAVGFSQNYIVDDDSELKPGKTISKEMDCYDAFDSYQVFLSGRR